MNNMCKSISITNSIHTSSDNGKQDPHYTGADDERAARLVTPRPGPYALIIIIIIIIIIVIIIIIMITIIMIIILIVIVIIIIIA